jgi:hypothetical protein
LNRFGGVLTNQSWNFDKSDLCRRPGGGAVPSMLHTAGICCRIRPVNPIPPYFYSPLPLRQCSPPSVRPEIRRLVGWPCRPFVYSSLPLLILLPTLALLSPSSPLSLLPAALPFTAENSVGRRRGGEELCWWGEDCRHRADGASGRSGRDPSPPFPPSPHSSPPHQPLRPSPVRP